MKQGASIRKYVLLEKLGEGGMGVVWKARDTELDRLVVIKAIHDDYALQAELRKRFIDEARIQARLVHPNICTLFDAFEEERKLFLVMELIEGQTLKHLIEAEGKGLPAARVVEIARGVLSGLHFAHEHGVVHRDIKPSNIMVDRHGHVKIMDFGIAKVAGGERMGKTKTGMMIGTPEYMSPEQILGKDLDGRSDIYSFGIMLYEMVTGKLPFERTSSEFEIQKFHVDGQLPDVRGRDADAPEWLAEVLQRCTQKNAGDRFPSAAAVLQHMAEAAAPGAAVWPGPARGADAAQHISGKRAGVPRILVWGIAGAVVAVMVSSGLYYAIQHMRLKKYDVTFGSARNMTLVLLPAGEFKMGSPASEEGRDPLDEEQRKVMITNRFYMSTHEVTQAQWKEIMGKNPSRWQGDDLPVDSISWYDAEEFCRQLTRREQAAGRLPARAAFRLPTEAEWEYACRAKTETPFYSGTQSNQLAVAGWFIGNADGQPHAVGQKKPNRWGLYDMHGNVWEWCADWYSVSGNQGSTAGRRTETHRVLRGGSWNSSAVSCRSAMRNPDVPSAASDDYGMRVVLTLGD